MVKFSDILSQNVRLNESLTNSKESSKRSDFAWYLALNIDDLSLIEPTEASYDQPQSQSQEEMYGFYKRPSPNYYATERDFKNTCRMSDALSSSINKAATILRFMQSIHPDPLTHYSEEQIIPEDVKENLPYYHFQSRSYKFTHNDNSEDTQQKRSNQQSEVNYFDFNDIIKRSNELL